MNMPKDVEFIIEEIEKNGFEAFIVGGCVRDALLHKEPEDWDITTSAKPEEIKKIFKKTIDTGIEHGTVSILLGRNTYEVTTYRLDGKYSDGRHPDKVEFSPLLEEDLKRRDFTINAMAYSKKVGLVDLFEGEKDLKKGIIRCVGVAKERFGEDALRMLRAIRFSAVLGFEIEKNTAKAIVEIAPNLLKVSKERILVEFNKSLLSSNVEKVNLIFEYGLYKYISKSFEKLEKQDINSLKLINKLSKKKYIRLAAFFSYANKDIALSILKELKSDNDTYNRVKVLLSYLREDIEETGYGIKKLLNNIESDNFDSLLELKNIFLKEDIKKVKIIKDEIISNNEAYKLSMLDITGSDLINLGIEKGPNIGNILEYLLDEVMKSQLNNHKKELELEVKRRYG